MERIREQFNIEKRGCTPYTRNTDNQAVGEDVIT